MNRYARLLAAFGAEPIAINLGWLARYLGQQDLPKFEAALAPQRAAAVKRGPGAVEVISVNGVISAKPDIFERYGLGKSALSVAGAVRRAVADERIKAIVLDVNSPGGTVYGVPEAAAEILSLRGTKPIIAVANHFMASAAYWLASACDEIVVSPSAEVGSIGVYTMHVDFSQALEAEGVKITFIQAGEHKTEGNPFQPLSEEAQAAIQAAVDHYYGMFLAAVARGRGRSVAEVREKFGKGRLDRSQTCVDCGMADRIATMGETLERLGVPREAIQPRQASLLDNLDPQAAAALAEPPDRPEAEEPSAEEDQPQPDIDAAALAGRRQAERVRRLALLGA